MNLRAKLLLFCVLFPFTTSASAFVPPEYVEPTRAEMKSLDFKFSFKRDDAGSSIDWRYPKRVRNQHF